MISAPGSLRRFTYLEEHTIRQGTNLTDMSLHEMDTILNEARSRKLFSDLSPLLSSDSLFFLVYSPFTHVDRYLPYPSCTASCLSLVLVVECNLLINNDMNDFLLHGYWSRKMLI